MCLTLLQELKGRLYFEDYTYSNCVNSIILLNFVYLVFFFFFFQYINIKAVTWLHIYSRHGLYNYESDTSLSLSKFRPGNYHDVSRMWLGNKITLTEFRGSS